MSKIPKHIIDYCNQFEMCKGCPMECVAPIGAGYDQWIKNTIDKIERVGAE